MSGDEVEAGRSPDAVDGGRGSDAGATGPHARPGAGSLRGSNTTDAAPPLVLLGCDFRVAPASLRGSLVLDAREREDLLRGLEGSAGAAGLVVLNTCNRTEWIVETPHPAWTVEILSAWMQRRFRAARPDLEAPPRPRAHQGLAAVRHFLRVAVGLESLVPGEREIAGQCSRALAAARAAGQSSQLLDQLGHAAGRAVRRMERLGRFRDSSRGVPGVTVDFILGRLGDLGRPPVVGVAGLGAMGRRIAQALAARQARVVTFNRTAGPEKPLPLADLPRHLAELDALVVATGAPHAAIELVLAAREPRLLVVDIGVPPQVAVVAERSAGIELIGIDDLPLGGRAVLDPRDALLADQAVDLGVQEFLLACERRGASRLLEALAARREELRGNRLPSLLDEHLPDLDPTRRRKLLGALTGLLRDQQRALLEAIEDGAARETRGDGAARGTRQGGDGVVEDASASRAESAPSEPRAAATEPAS